MAGLPFGNGEPTVSTDEYFLEIHGLPRAGAEARNQQRDHPSR